ncbi:hypothetical protein TWF481_012200 [Arthrobotrys musiformis]|uniref:Uncharacterized protein n=1 Tax=Arthrobotrys musiformis TaxID=47236 RepID=A0AAV9VYF4_9PEZI
MPRCYKIDYTDLSDNFTRRKEIARAAYEGRLTVEGVPEFLSSHILYWSYRDIDLAFQDIYLGTDYFVPPLQVCTGAEIVQYPDVRVGDVDAELVWDCVDCRGLKPYKSVKPLDSASASQ